MQTDIGDRHRLHRHVTRPALRIDADLRFDCTHQRALECQNAIAVVRRSLGKQNERITRKQTLANLVVRFSGLRPPRALDEHGLLQFRQDAENRPAGNLALRHERNLRETGEYENVEIGSVVRHHQHAASLNRFADDSDLEYRRSRHKYPLKLDGNDL